MVTKCDIDHNTGWGVRVFNSGPDNADAAANYRGVCISFTRNNIHSNTMGAWDLHALKRSEPRRLGYMWFWYILWRIDGLELCVDIESGLQLT